MIIYGVILVVSVFVMVWVQWVTAVQSGANELAVGGESYEAPAERVPPTEPIGAVP